MRYLATAALTALLLLTLVQPLAAQQPFEITSDVDIRVDEKGNATLRFVQKYHPSPLADALKPMYKIMEDFVKAQAIEQARSSFAVYGWEVKNLKCEIAGLDEGETLQMTITGEITALARSDNIWTISFEPIDPEGDARRLIDTMNNLRAMLLTFGSGAQLKISQDLATILPRGAEITNAAELAGVGTWRIEYGGGSSEESTLSIERIDGRSAVVVRTEIFVTTDNLTITPQELLHTLPTHAIEYTGALAEEGPSHVVYGAIAAALVVLAAIVILLRRR
ncbi:MAG: hypothetical protein QMC89_04255 [Candidatus Hodarchaeaceae archaeon]|nr:hypothetical protein [Candidatus Hodarchaeaceae archaeon]